MNKRRSSQEGYFGRQSRERDDRGGGREDRQDSRNFRSVKRQKNDSSDTESHHDVEILYNRVNKGRGLKNYDPRNYDDSAANFEGQLTLQPPQRPMRQRGPGLLGDAPEPVQKQRQFSHSNFQASSNSFQGIASGPNEYVDGPNHSNTSQHSLFAKPSVTQQLISMNGKHTDPHFPLALTDLASSVPRPQPLMSPEPQLQHNVPAARQQRDGFWNLPSVCKGKNGNSCIKNKTETVSGKKSEEPPWKSQIKELKDYIVKLENEKKNMVFNLETEKIEQLRDYILKIEVEKQELSEKVKNQSLGKGKDEEHMIEVIKSNIERVKQAQEQENKKIDIKKSKLASEEKRLEEERKKLDKAKIDIKMSLDNGMKLLSTEKSKMEAELQKKKKFAFNDKLITKIKALEEVIQNEKNLRSEEEKRHLAIELEELETRKEMTIKTIEGESKIEDLEAKLEEMNNELYELKQKMAKKDSENRHLLSEVNKAAKQNDELVQKLSSTKSKFETEVNQRVKEHQALKSNFDAGFAIFTKKRENFDENEKIRCVFCPKENLQPISNFLFHIAREHMFDQYKASDTTEDSVKVGMFLKVLEEKARKELASEMKILNDNIEDLKEQAFKKDEINEERQGMIEQLSEKGSALERDIETLLESEANHKNQIENLVLRNNTLVNQIRNVSVSDTMRIEHQEMGKKINVLGREVNDLKERRLALEREVDGLRNRWKEENSEKISWKTKCRELTYEVDNLRKRLVDHENNRDNVKETLKQELHNANVEKDNLRQRIRNLEEKSDELVSHKAVAEAQLLEIKAENEAMKEFRSDLNAINDVVCDDMRVENKTLKSKSSSLQIEVKNLKSELSKAKTSKNFVLNELNLAKKEANGLKLELSNAKNENLSAQQRLTEAMEKIQVFEKDMEDCLKEQKEFDNNTSFSFDMGIENILKAPLDVINLQLESIDIDQLENMDVEDEILVDNKMKDEVKEASFEIEDEILVEYNIKEDGNISEKVGHESPVVVTAVDIHVNDDMDREDDMDGEDVESQVQGEKNAEWSDDDFDYDLLNDSQEEEIKEKVNAVQPCQKRIQTPIATSLHPTGCDCIDCELLNSIKDDEIQKKEIKKVSCQKIKKVCCQKTKKVCCQKTKKFSVSSSLHISGCDCVDCDDCDVLHGYVDGQPQGIKEMMHQSSC